MKQTKKLIQSRAHILIVTVLATLVVSFALDVFASEESEVILEITDVRNDKGQIALAVFPESAAKTFPKKPELAVLKALVDAKTGSMRVSLGHLKPGSYAVSLLHDENRDGDMNFSFIGMPKEGFGFSRDPRIRFGAPDFEDCTIKVQGEKTEISIRAKYF